MTRAAPTRCRPRRVSTLSCNPSRVTRVASHGRFRNGAWAHTASDEPTRMAGCSAAGGRRPPPPPSREGRTLRWCGSPRTCVYDGVDTWCPPAHLLTALLDISRRQPLTDCSPRNTSAGLSASVASRSASKKLSNAPVFDTAINRLMVSLWGRSKSRFSGTRVTAPRGTSGPSQSYCVAPTAYPLARRNEAHGEQCRKGVGAGEDGDEIYRADVKGSNENGTRRPFRGTTGAVVSDLRYQCFSAPRWYSKTSPAAAASTHTTPSAMSQGW